MNELATATVLAVRDKIRCLDKAELGPEYSYQSLPLCAIDAVFSIGVLYKNAQNAVQAWCAAQEPSWLIPRDAKQERRMIADLVRATRGCSGEDLAQRFFGGNRQRTSPRNGILKADAVVLFADALSEAGIDDFADMRDADRVARASEAVRRIPGQRSGLSFDYFSMLAGDDSFVKADRMICRFVAEAASRPSVSLQEAREATIAACGELAREFSDLTPRLLDYLIWSYQSAKAAPGRGTRRQSDGVDPKPSRRSWPVCS